MLISVLWIVLQMHSFRSILFLIILLRSIHAIQYINHCIQWQDIGKTEHKIYHRKCTHMKEVIHMYICMLLFNRKWLWRWLVTTLCVRMLCIYRMRCHHQVLYLNFLYTSHSAFLYISFSLYICTSKTVRQHALSIH